MKYTDTLCIFKPYSHNYQDMIDVLNLLGVYAPLKDDLNSYKTPIKVNLTKKQLCNSKDDVALLQNKWTYTADGEFCEGLIHIIKNINKDRLE